MADVLPGDLADYPPELRTVDKLEEVLAWIRVAFPQRSIRKQKLYHWAKSLSLDLDPSYYRRLE